MGTELAGRVRKLLADREAIEEIRMFGGLCFMMRGNMLVCAMRDGRLLARVGEDGMAEALARPGASPMSMSGREMKAYVAVDPETLDDEALREWVSMAGAFVGTLPVKKKKGR